CSAHSGRGLGCRAGSTAGRRASSSSPASTATGSGATGAGGAAGLAGAMTGSAGGATGGAGFFAYTGTGFSTGTKTGLGGSGGGGRRFSKFRVDNVFGFSSCRNGRAAGCRDSVFSGNGVTSAGVGRGFTTSS